MTVVIDVNVITKSGAGQSVGYSIVAFKLLLLGVAVVCDDRLLPVASFAKPSVVLLREVDVMKEDEVLEVAVWLLRFAS